MQTDPNWSNFLYDETTGRVSTYQGDIDDMGVRIHQTNTAAYNTCAPY